MHLTYIHLANQRNMVVAKHLAALELRPRLRHTCRAPSPQGRIFFFFGRTFAPGIHQTGQDGASLSCSHRTSQTSDLLQKLGCQPAGEKKKKLGISDFFGSLWHVARLGHVSHDPATGTRWSSKVRCTFDTKIVGVFRQEPCH